MYIEKLVLSAMLSVLKSRWFFLILSQIEIFLTSHVHTSCDFTWTSTRTHSMSREILIAIISILKVTDTSLAGVTSSSSEIIF